MMRTAVLALTLSIGFGGCASAGEGAAPERSTVLVSMRGSSMPVSREAESRGVVQTYSSSREEVWAALQQVYRQLEIPVGLMNEAEGIIGNRQHTRSRTLAGERLSRYLHCGHDATGVPMADSYRVQLSVVTSIRATEGGAVEVETLVGGTAAPVATGGSMVHCSTTGALEQRMTALLAQRLIQ
jgi:hypothetical protein